MGRPLRYTATCPKHVEDLLADELVSLGATDVRPSVAAVTFTGSLDVGLRACLWSRVASRVLLRLGETDAGDADSLYEGLAVVPWEEHVPVDGTLAVDAVGTSEGLTHTGFTARRVKDAVVDRIRERYGRRPSVDLDRPDVRVNVRIRRERATVSIDLSGEPLHQRGYRLPGEASAAPLKENLAAAVLARADWSGVAAAGGAFCDPMCGTGTIAIEAAMIASDQAPGLLRDHWGFEGWLGHDADAWAALLDEADDRAEAGREALPPIVAGDADEAAVETARGAARRAGFARGVRLHVRGVSEAGPPEGSAEGLLAANPPYGVRLEGSASSGSVRSPGSGSSGSGDSRAGDSRAGLEALYDTLGATLASRFRGWRAAVLTADPKLARAIGLRSHKQHALYNGPLEVKLYLFELTEDNERRPTV